LIVTDLDLMILIGIASLNEAVSLIASLKGTDYDRNS